MTEQDFYVTTMPSTRPANYYLGYLEGSVFLDFDNVETRVCLKRISFDGYGCCELADTAIPLSEEDSKIFKDLLQDVVKEQFQDVVKDQLTLKAIIKKAITINKKLIWTDALEEYELI
jgi:hypothetical protein